MRLYRLAVETLRSRMTAWPPAVAVPPTAVNGWTDAGAPRDAEIPERDEGAAAGAAWVLQLDDRAGPVVGAGTVPGM